MVCKPIYRENDVIYLA